MKRTIIGAIIGSVFGGIALFPPAIPLYLTLSFELLNFSRSTEILFWLLPVIGLIIGGFIGGIIGKYRISLSLFGNKYFSIFFWCIFMFCFLGLEIGFVLSPVTMIGLGNTSTPIDLWIFPILIAFAGTILGAIIGFLALVIYILSARTRVRQLPTL